MTLDDTTSGSSPDHHGSMGEAGPTQQALLRKAFLKCLLLLTGPYRNASVKSLWLLGNWPAIEQLVVGGIPVHVAPSFVEIHVSEPCQLACTFCRGELRPVPATQKMMDGGELLGLIDEIHALNPEAFVRVSGIIGEPLVHKNIVDALERLNAHRLDWGLTTNGLLLDRPGIGPALMRARFAHVSLDAGSDEVYQSLKKGRPGDFERVLANLAMLMGLKRDSASAVEVVVSFLLQSENWREIPELIGRLARTGVDTLAIKMQHFDPRRLMSVDEVKEAYRRIDAGRLEHASSPLRVVTVQDEAEALMKLRAPSQRQQFRRCYANLLGTNSCVTPRGEVQTCCQYYGGTLGVQGQISEGFAKVWDGEQRLAVLERDPRLLCGDCSPSDELVNRFVEFLVEAHEQDATFLAWAGETIRAGQAAPAAGP